MFEDAEPISPPHRGAPGEFVSRARRFAHLRGEAADLLGHNGEAASGITCARGFDGGVQREDVRLERDVFDGVGQLRDALGVVFDLLDGAHGAGYRVAAFLDRAQYIGGVGIHGPDAFGVLSHHVRDALNVGGKLFDGGGLLGGALRDGLGTVRHLR